MDNIYTYLNYGSFTCFYILSLLYVFRKYTEIIGFFMLTIVHAAFMVFSGKGLLLSLQDYFTNKDGLGSDRVNGGMALLIGLLLSGMTLQLVSLIFIILMLITLRSKFIETNGSPITLSKRYQRYLDAYKDRLIPIFLITFTIVMSIIFFPDNMNKSLSNIFAEFMDGDRIGFNIIMGLSIILVVLSSQEVYYSNQFIRQRRTLLIK